MITSDNSQRDVQSGHTEVLSDLERLKQKRDAIAVVYHSTFFKEGKTVLMKPTTKHVYRQPDAETMSQTTVPLSVCWALMRSARGFEMWRVDLNRPYPRKGEAVTKMLITLNTSQVNTASGHQCVHFCHLSIIP